MSLTNYTDLQASVADFLKRTDLTAVIPDLITLFEACANRRLRVRLQEAVAVLTPKAVATVTGAAASGTLVRLTVNSTAGMTSGDTATVASIVGTTEANGVFALSVVDATHLDLLGSTFANAYVSGGTVTDAGNVALPTDYLAWRRVTWMGNPLRELQYVHPSVLTSYYPDLPVNIPSLFTIEGSILRVMPADPTQLVFLYWQKIPGLAANATNWLMTAHPDLYLFGTLAESGGYTVDNDKLAMWKARRDELFDEIEKLDSKTRGPSAVRPMGPTP